MGLFDKGIYVHYYPEHIRNYTNVKEKILSNYKDEVLKASVLKNLRKPGKQVNKTQEEAFFDFLGGFGETSGSDLSSALESYFTEENFQLTTPSSSFGEYENLYDALNKVIKSPSVQIYTDINNQLKKILTELQNGGAIQGINQSIISSYVTEAISQGVFTPPANANHLKRSKRGSQLYEELKKIFNSTKNQGVAINPKTEFYSQTNIMTAIAMMTQLLDGYSSGGKQVHIDDSEILNDYLSFIINRLPSAIGFAYQAIVTNMASKGADKICEDFSIKLNETGAGRAKVKFTPNKDGNAAVTTVNTQDLGITVTFQDQRATLNTVFNIPGISLKYNAAVANNLKTNAFIKLRGKGTKLGTLLHDLDNQTLSAIYNIFAGYNHRSKLIKTNPIDKTVYEDVWAGLKVALAVNGLIGQAQAGDFAYYFVVSNKVYTVPDIIRKLILQANNDGAFDDIGLDMAKVPTLRPSQKEIVKENAFIKGNNIQEAAQERSQKVIEKIYNADIVAGIRLKISKLKI